MFNILLNITNFPYTFKYHMHIIVNCINKNWIHFVEINTNNFQTEHSIQFQPKLNFPYNFNSRKIVVFS